MRLVRGAVFGDDYEVNDEVLSGAVDDDFFFFDLFGELADFNFFFLDCCTAEYFLSPSEARAGSAAERSVAERIHRSSMAERI